MLVGQWTCHFRHSKTSGYEVNINNDNNIIIVVNCMMSSKDQIMFVEAKNIKIVVRFRIRN